MQANARTKSSHGMSFDRLVGWVPAQYRQEVTRVAKRIRDSLPPVVLEHRLNALERHMDERLAGIERKLDEMLHRLESHSAR